VDDPSGIWRALSATIALDAERPRAMYEMAVEDGLANAHWSAGQECSYGALGR
jgi:hypothetical protein